MKIRVAAAALFFLVGVVALAATLPTGFTETSWEGFTNPTAMAVAPDGRVFVCEQGGLLRIIKNGTLLPTPFLSLTVNEEGERGLLGVTFDPDFSQNQYVYVYYTVPSPVHNRVSRFTANGDVAAAGSETILLELNNLSAEFHNGGAIHFGQDGKLYVGVGDNLDGANAQSLNILLGKVLRIGVPPDPLIPTDNPFYGQATGNNRAIWAMGLRNPFTFGVQPGTGRIFVNDVGENSFEEINDGGPGDNYGWPNCEGDQGNCGGFEAPFYFYPHSEGCSIAGGDFYNPQVAQFPADFVGKYLFADYCGGFIKRIDPSSGAVTPFVTDINRPVDVDVSYDGSLFYIARQDGKVFQVTYTGSSAPEITQDPESQTISVGHPVTFTVAASGAPPLTYQWQRNSVNIGGATSSSYTKAAVTLGDNGAQFRCVVSNGSGSDTSAQAVLTVLNNQPPVATITAPAAGTTYAGGDAINYSGTGTDAEDGTLGGSAFTWWVDFHHDTHIHPFVPPTSGSSSGSFTIPTLGEVSPNVWYRIHLRVEDSVGLTTEVIRDVLPRTTTMTFATNPTGLQLTLDGQPIVAPMTVLGVENIQRTISAPSPQGSEVFLSWSDGGSQTHTISTPVNDTTYTANFSGGEPAPGVSSIGPDSGPALGGTSVMVTGSNFQSGATLQVGGVSATGVVVVDAEHITGNTPALSPATLNDVTVTNPGGINGMLPSGFFGDFLDVPQANIFHGDIEKIFRNGITAGCGNGNYCPISLVTRAQMAAFLLKGEHGGAYQPPTCSATVFADEPCPGGINVNSVNQLAAEGVTGGCGGGNYCPMDPLTRAQMAVFLLKGKHGGSYQPPACASTIFPDVPCPGAPFVDWINQLSAEGITAGCGGGNYCPTAPTPRQQMATFLVRTFIIP